MLTSGFAEAYAAGTHVRKMNISNATIDELDDLLEAIVDARINVQTTIERADISEDHYSPEWWVNVRHKRRKIGQEEQHVQKRRARCPRPGDRPEERRAALLRAVHELLDPLLASAVIELADEFDKQLVLSGMLGGRRDG